MAGNTKDERDFCINLFPDLGTDNYFRVNSDCDYRYNCIGFAIGYTDIWVAPFPRKIPTKDDISLRIIPWFWWPNVVPFDENPCSLVRTFEYFGFETCDDDSIEPNYDKVALYSHMGKWTHAARIIDEGVYHSKLGECFDIIHRKGNVLEQTTNPMDSYGKPFVFMRRKKADQSILSTKRPPMGLIRFAGYVFKYMTPSY